jgi:hypothetical protein
MQEMDEPPLASPSISCLPTRMSFLMVIFAYKDTVIRESGCITLQEAKLQIGIKETTPLTMQRSRSIQLIVPRSAQIVSATFSPRQSR